MPLTDDTHDIVLRLRRMDCCALSDALDKEGLSGTVSGLMQRSGHGRIAGRVITVTLGVGDPPAGPPKHLGSTAIGLGGPDHVIVVEQRTGIEAGCWGGLLTLGAKLRGIAGVVAEGFVRDIDEAERYEFPIFSRGLTALTARGRIVEKATNAPVAIGRVSVNPGDFVVADRSGVVFIPESEVLRVILSAEAIVAREAGIAKSLLAGSPIADAMGGNYEYMLQADRR